MGRKKDKPQIADIEITGVAAEGNAIARHDDKVIFIPYGAPGDIVDIQVDKKRHSFLMAHIIKYKQLSPLRVKPLCSHFGICGGCKWQHVPYEYQLGFKRQQVIDNLQRIAKVPFPDVKECMGSSDEWAYRNKVEYTFSNRRWLTYEQIASPDIVLDRDGAGFHIPGSFDKVLDIDYCYLVDDFSNRIRNFVKYLGLQNNWSFYDLKNQCGFLRTIMVRTFTTGQSLVVISVGDNDREKIDFLMNAVSSEFPSITSLSYTVNKKVNDSLQDLDIITWKGFPYAEERLGGLVFRISPKSFYQTNSRQATVLYGVVSKMADLHGEELVYDLYTGTGTIANYLAPLCKKVIGIEYVKEAIDDAWLNSELNGIKNTVFYAGDMKDVLTDAFVMHNGRPDVIVVDPPRAGMHNDVVTVILNAAPKKIVYVSCNPATQARDVALLSEKYEIAEVQPVDMFPHTHHVENVICLSLKSL